MTTTPDQGEEGKGKNSVNIILNQIHGSTELMQLHTAHRYFKGDTPAVGDVLGLLSKTLILERLLTSLERNQRFTWRESLTIQNM